MAETAPELHDLLASLATEQVSDQHTDLDLMSTTELVRAMNQVDSTVTDAVASASEHIAVAVDGIAARMAQGGRLFYFGAGTPGRLGVLDASEIPPTFGVPAGRVIGVIAGGDTAIRTAVEGAEDSEELGRADVASYDVTELDTVVGISASGRTPYVMGALLEGQQRGALTIGLSANANSLIGEAADIAIDVPVGPEFVAGSTRLKAGTAQKMVLNMLTTLTMVRLGKTYGSLMVDVQSTNEKLRSRAERTVMQATGVDRPTASHTLDCVDTSVKAAILVHTVGVSPETAVALLAENGGFLRRAIDEAGGPATAASSEREEATDAR